MDSQGCTSPPYLLCYHCLLLHSTHICPVLNLWQALCLEFHLDFYTYLWLLMEKAMAPHSSTLAWKIPWMEEPGRRQAVHGLHRVGHDWDFTLTFHFMHWRRKWQPTPVFLPGESQGQGSLWAAVYGVAQSRTRLKRLSSSMVAHASRLASSMTFTSLLLDHLNVSR